MRTLRGRTSMPQSYLRYQKVVILGVLLAALALVTGAGSNKSDTSTPPVAAVRMVTDEYFGVKVADPYRYLEDLSNPEVTAWLKGQLDYTRAWLGRIPRRTAIFTLINSLDISAPARITLLTLFLVVRS